VGLPFIRTSKATAATAKRPNLLLVFPDQHRFDWTALNPAIPIRTPNIVRLAEEGTYFPMAYCPSPVCAPSRACLATGKQYGRTGVLGNGDNLPDGSTTLYTLLNAAGYRVGSVGKLDLRKPEHDWGPDGMHRIGDRVIYREWGFTDGLDSEGKGDSLRGIKTHDDTGKRYGESPYTTFLDDRGDGSLDRYAEWWDACRASPGPANSYAYTVPVQLADEAYNDNWVGQNALNIIENYPKNQPWFLQVNFPGPHNPTDITPAMKTWYEGVGFPQPFKNDQLDASKHEEIREHYSAMVENIDTWLGKYLDALERRGELENTVVVYSSDHGEMLGDHNRWAKTVPYQASSGVPLVVMGPEVKTKQVHRGATATLDVTATFLDYAGIDVPKDMDSRTLRPLLGGESSAARPQITSGLKEWRMVCDGQYKLIRGFSEKSGDRFSGADEGASAEGAPDSEYLLFDLAADPWESQDISKSRPDDVARLVPFLPLT
jgi:arylsulfatase A-like enzyme